jgi:hypothetical protein
MLVISNSELTADSDVMAQVLQHVGTLGLRRLAPDWYVARLPHADTLADDCKDLVQFWTSQMSSEDHVALFICLAYSASGDTCASRFTVEIGKSEVDAAVATIDLRVVYESYMVLLHAAVAQGKPDPEGAAAYLQLALATRLCGRGEPGLDRIALGLTASGTRYGTHAPTADDWFASHKSLVARSFLGPDGHQLLFRIILHFVVMHEIFHTVLARDPTRRSDFLKAMRHAAESVHSDAEHMARHQAEEEQRLGTSRFKDIAHAVVESALSASPLVDSDYEEFACDSWAAFMVLDALRRWGELDGDTAPFIREAVLGALRTFASVSGFMLLAPTVNEMVSEPDGDRFGDLVSRASNKLERLNVILTVRLRLLQLMLDGHVVVQFRQMMPEVDEQLLYSFVSQGNDFPRRQAVFDLELHELLRQRLFSVPGLLELSSRGRGLALLYGDALQSPEESGDPFSLYAFGEIWHDRSE